MLRLLVLLSFIVTFAVPTGAETLKTLKRDEVWSGTVHLKSNILIPDNVTLTIQPGTNIIFPENGSMMIQGRLLAKGTAKNPIIMHSSTVKKAGNWQGLVFEQGSRQGSSLSYVKFDSALQALTLTGAKVHIVDSTITGGTKGIISGVGAYLLVERTNISDMSDGGIDASVGSQGKILNSQIQRTTNFAIQIGKKSALFISGNQISNCKVGIFTSGDSPPIEKNRIDHCEAGIVVLQTSPDTVVRSNKISDCKTGIACHQFASPLVEKNAIERCDLGIECFQASSPIIRQNLLNSNQRGLSCVQLCNPSVNHNDFTGNRTAIYLHLSSYAQIHDNNFDGNTLHIELDNMSSDWEVRAQKKPVRSREKQSELLAMKERATPTEFQVDAGKEAYVNAKENYWGKETTAEIEKKGGNANITTFQDGFDIPVRTYDGWPGEYKQDRIRYDNWRKKKISGTFIP